MSGQMRRHLRAMPDLLTLLIPSSLPPRHRFTEQNILMRPFRWSDMTSVDTVTQWRDDWLSASVLNHRWSPTLLSDSQVSISLIIHSLWWTVSEKVKAHVVLACTNGVSPNHLPVIVTSDTCPLPEFEGGLNLLHEADDDAGIYSDFSTRDTIILNKM